MATDVKQDKTLPHQPKSHHTSDPFLQPFLSPSFDPTAYLNTSLPPLATKSPTPSNHNNAVPLSDLAAQAQTLLSQLDAHTTRLSDTLTRITDDILRSGGRMSYEVEMLRGEALSLEELLFEKLAGQIGMFVPGGLQKEGEAKTEQEGEEKRLKEMGKPAEEGEAKTVAKPEGQAADGAEEPESIKQLRTLTLVRERLDSVIKIFGDAMEFGFPPSEVSVSSGFLSVSAPEPGSDLQSSEEKGQQTLQRLRDEISGLLNNKQDPVSGIEKAAERIEQLKNLATVWTGTAEERGRTKFIESLAKMVEDRHRELLKELDSKRSEATAATATATAATTSQQGRGGGGGGSAANARDGAGETLPGGFGLMSQLQKLRGGL
ncbi:hypothetical protein BBK36DRAFT_1137607 [Trichoderma citrinoviride]|uniref:Uncharacterized protein n=1 Tax=Trichoderma citrinoviride TaxID=58853 RepID=A0A2T4BNT7_9HYPO|nr:hypothetical protein BBK36DRAFT_1137607 [Trichoderma citrinoviride]PTB70962.1 hypothetical protein BBK36DRAFT_1137607 [Trichoderma citrinoviride]